MLKKNDFVEIEYTGKIQDSGEVFDTTNEELAKETGLFSEQAQYGKVVICLGQHQLIEGLDNKLTGKEPNKSYTVELSPEEGFGKKSAKLVQLISTNKFKQHNIVPQPGMQVNIDELTGVIKTVTGGRTLVDFNHPLSGRVLLYEVKLGKKIVDDTEKIKNFVKLSLGIKDPKVTFSEGKATIETPQEVKKEVGTELTKHIKEVVPSVKSVEYKKTTPKAK